MARKICVITNSRADYSRLKTLLQALKKRKDVEVLLFVMGSHLLSDFGLTVRDIEADGFKVDYRLYTEVDGKLPVTMSKSVGNAILELTTAFDNFRPDIVVVHGDRFEALAATIAASMMNIHVAHLQGGEVTGTIDEHIRHAITKLAHLHFPSSSEAFDRIVRLGEAPDRVWNFGCPSSDLLLKVKKLTFTQLKKEIFKYAKNNLWKKAFNQDFVLVVQHPVTTEFSDTAQHFSATIDALKKFGDHSVLMLWPNIDAGSEPMVDMIRRFDSEEGGRIGVFDNFPVELFINIMRHAKVMVGNSSAGVREASYFGTPVVNIGTRQTGRERTRNVIDVPYDAEKIIKAIKEHLAHGRYEVEQPYGDGRAGAQIAKVLAEVDIKDSQKRINF